MLRALEAIVKTFRGIKVRARKVTRAAGRIMRKPAPEGARRTVRSRAAELFCAAKKTPSDIKVISLRKNLIKKFNAAKTLEAKLKIADRVYTFKNQPELALRMYNKIASDALKNPDKYFNIAEKLKKRALLLKKMVKTNYLKKQSDMLLHRANHLMEYFEEAEKFGKSGSNKWILNELAAKFEKIKPAERAASIEKEFNITRDIKTKFRIAYITWERFKNHELAIKLHERLLEKMLKMRPEEKLYERLDAFFQPKIPYKTRKFLPNSRVIGDAYYEIYSIALKVIHNRESSAALISNMQKKLARARQLISDTKYELLIDDVNIYIKDQWGVTPEEINALIHTQL